LLARLALERDQWAVARHHIAWLLDRRAEDPEALALLARLEWRSGNRYKAEALWRRLVRRGWRDPEPYRELARILGERRQWVQAAMVLQRGMEANGPIPALLREAVPLWKRLRHPEVALGLLATCTEDSLPEDLLFQKAFLARRVGWSAEARRVYEALLARAPDHPQALFNLSLLQRAEGDLEGALETLRRLVDRRPDFEPGHAELARVLLTLGRRDEAREVLERYLTLGQRPRLLEMARETLARLAAPPAAGSSP
jgi:tetratricopeptide (TPR) repeat protein